MANVLVGIGDFFAVAAVPPPFLASHFHIELIPMTLILSKENLGTLIKDVTLQITASGPPPFYEVFDILHQDKSLFFI